MRTNTHTTTNVNLSAKLFYQHFPSLPILQGQFTSPKKAFMMREAANRQENREGGDSASGPSKSSSSSAAPDVLVVPKESDSAVGDTSNVSGTGATAGHGEVM
jgi:hypothetical protein